MVNIGLALAQALRGGLEGAALGFNLKDRSERRRLEEEELERRRRLDEIALAVGQNPGGVFLSDQAPTLGVDPLTGATDPNAPEGFQVTDDDVRQLIPGVFQRQSLSAQGLREEEDRRRAERERANITARGAEERARDEARRRAEQEAAEQAAREEEAQTRALAAALGIPVETLAALSPTDRSGLARDRLNPRPRAGGGSTGKTAEEKAIEAEDRRRKALIARQESQIRGTERQLTRADRELNTFLPDDDERIPVQARADSLLGIIDDARGRADSLAATLGDPPPEIVPPGQDPARGSTASPANVSKLDPASRTQYNAQIQEAVRKFNLLLQRGIPSDRANAALQADVLAINRSFGLEF